MNGDGACCENYLHLLRDSMFYSVIFVFIAGNKVNKDGLFSSTLSSRYDAHTTDSSWVCVFCKQGPHSVISGDPLRPHPNIVGPHIAPGTYTVSGQWIFYIFPEIFLTKYWRLIIDTICFGNRRQLVFSATCSGLI